MFRLPKVVVREEGTEASSPPDAQKGGVSTRDRCPPCPWSYPSCASIKGPAVKTSWSCEQAAPLHGRKMRATDHFRSHGASLCMQVVAFVNLPTEYGQQRVCKTLVRDVLSTSSKLVLVGP